MTLTDFIGLLGTFTVLAAYFCLQFGIVRQDQVTYSAMNIAGACLIIVSLFSSFNLAAFTMQIAWIAIGVFGLVKALRARWTGASSHQ